VNTDAVKREDWVVGGLAVLLVIDLLEFPWHTVAGGMISGISFPSISNRATGPPDGLLGVLAVLATLAIVFDLLLEHFSPDTQIPSINGSRTLTRFALAITATGLLALKFILHLTLIGDLGSGFWFGAVVSAALVYATTKAWQANPTSPAGAPGPAGARTRPNGDSAAADGPADSTDAREESQEPADREQPTEAPEASAQSES
jgi:hypothetical protein